MTTLLAAGAVFANDYRIVRPLNQGGMGAVYIVDQLSTGKQRALKLMHPTLVSDPELRRRFEQEARVGSQIASEHVVEVNAAGIDAQSGLPYLVMELLEGEDLSTRIKRSPLTLEELRAIYEQLCHAMNAAHEVGVIHRDLKPENVFLAVSRRAGGSPFTVKVLDFGIAKLAAEAGTQSTSGMGSPLWMAPEQTDRGMVTTAADVWALGLMAYYALTGTHFWRTANSAGGTMAQLLREIVLEPIPPVSQRASERRCESLLPSGFDAWFSKCVAREPSARFRHAGEAWKAMQAIVGADPLGATAMGGPPSSAPITPAVLSPYQQPPPPTPRVASAPAPVIGGATPAPMTTTQAPPSSGRWIIATAILAGLLIAGIGLAAAGFYVMRAKPQPAAPVTVASTAVVVPPPASSTPPVETASTSTAAAMTSPPPKSTATTTTTHKTPVVAATTAGEEDDTGPNGSMNNHVWKLKNGAHVRMIGAIVKNDSNVADAIVRHAVEWSAWQYNRCYDGAYGQAPPASMKAGTVTIGFDILDQLPRHGVVDKSDFAEESMNKCVVGTLIGQTINAAGPSGKGHITYSFRFVPN